MYQKDQQYIINITSKYFPHVIIFNLTLFIFLFLLSRSFYFYGGEDNHLSIFNSFQISSHIQVFLQVYKGFCLSFLIVTLRFLKILNYFILMELNILQNVKFSHPYFQVTVQISYHHMLKSPSTCKSFQMPVFLGLSLDIGFISYLFSSIVYPDSQLYLTDCTLKSLLSVFNMIVL